MGSKVAEQLRRSTSLSAFDVLSGVLATAQDRNVTIVFLNGLAAVKTAQAAHVVFNYARPGSPKRVRLVALMRLADLKNALQPADTGELNDLVKAALDDSFCRYTRRAFI